MKQVKTALIGFGYRGKQLLRLLRTIALFDVVAIADKRQCTDNVGTRFYSGGESYKDMLDEQQPDLVFITTPWHLHIEQALACLNHHCHVALEIKGGLVKDEYSPLIEAADRMGLKVFPLENTMFLREILAVKRMADEGVFGEIVYMRGGYRHDLRDILLDEHGVLGGRVGTESVWRSRFYTSRNGDIYPTHALGPLCMILGINRTDRLAYVMSFATKAVGLSQRMKELRENLSSEDGIDNNATRITLGDIISTQIETEGGALISLTHDTTLPRPRSLDFEVQGSRGIWDGVNRRIYIEGMNDTESWEDDSEMIEKYESAYWQRWGSEALVNDKHHNGMDYIMLRAVAEDLTGTTAYPATLRDLALWTSISVFSELSIKEHRRIALPYLG